MKLEVGMRVRYIGKSGRFSDLNELMGACGTVQYTQGDQHVCILFDHMKEQIHPLVESLTFASNTHLKHLKRVSDEN